MQANYHRENIFRQFIRCLEQATARIPEQYIHFPVAGQANPIYRERIYCYELYHQLRVATGDDFGYSLGGEVDKAGHPILSELSLDKTKPDLLVHQPGDMRGNLVVIEVKPVTAKTYYIRKDLHNLTAFVLRGEYYRAIYLIYGGSEREFANFRRRVSCQADKAQRDQIDLGIIHLYWHQLPGLGAMQSNWGAG